MYLTTEERAMASGQYGPGIKRCTDILIKFGKAFDAKKLVKISSAHVFNGFPVSLLEELTEGVTEMGTFTSIHPYMSLSDPMSWRSMGISEEHFRSKAREQEKRLEIYERVGIFQTYTCAPLLVGNVPKKGDCISWFGSSVQVFINSVIGARQNRDGAVVNMASAVTGRVPEYGFILDENRFARVLVKLEDIDVSSLRKTDFGAIGYYVGGIAQDRNVVVDAIDNVGIDKVRYLLTPLSTSGSVCMCHIVGFTPEAPDLKSALGGKQPAETIIVSKESIKQTKDLFGAPGYESIDLAIFGCPHCSVEELKELATLLEGRKVIEGKRLWIATGHQIYDLASVMGYPQNFDASGAVISSSCMATIPDCPIPENVEVVATNSFKTAHYVSAISQGRIKVRIGEANECIDWVTKG